MLGKLACFLLSTCTFSQKSFRNSIRVSNRLDTDQVRHFVWPDLGPNCLQRLSTDDKSLFAGKELTKQGGQVALNRSPEFCSQLTYRNLLKLTMFLVTPVGKPILVPRALFELIWKGSTTLCYIPNIKALSLMVSDKIFSYFSLYRPV